MDRQDGSAGQASQNEEFSRTSFLYGGNATYIETLRSAYDADPGNVSDEWRDYFAALNEPAERGPSWARSDWPLTPAGEMVAALTGEWDEPDVKSPKDAVKRVEAKVAARASAAGVTLDEDALRRATTDSIRAIQMIRAYRVRGHLAADLDPLKIHERPTQPELDPQTYGFEPADYDRKIFIDNYLGLELATVAEMVAILQRTYCSTIGVEFTHISDPGEKGWLQQRIEGPDKEVAFTPEGKKAILNKLIEAEGFEKFLDVKYTGTKRFGLDGGESLLPALEQIIKRGGALGVRDIVLGMAHRGRLNVLSQVMGKPPRAIFAEFKGASFKPDDVQGSGDVKYHLGASSDRAFDGNKVHLSLTANPSHLEIVDPVVLGKARAKQDQYGDRPGRRSVMPLLLHGDAAFAGQGVVAECLGLSGLKGHRTGGSLHFIINNQIGFTTDPRNSRSSPYPSDIAKMVEAPILHCNGDDPEAVVFCAKIATEFRQKFGKPVVVDMFCYRRYGHNEGDEPSFTQPLMYKVIRKHPLVTEIYAKRLEDEGVLKSGELEEMRAAMRSHFDEEFEAAQSYAPNKADWLDGRWADLEQADDETNPRRGETGVPIDRLRELQRKMTKLPKGFIPHRTVKRVLDNRLKTVEDGEGLDWATGEQLAFASLLDEGFPVRLSGQDVERGTFSQRHSVIIDQETEKRWTPLNHMPPGGKAENATYEVINSMLSEEAVLGFEYGYSLAEPKALTLWEAQFGDFANGAQVVIDQFLAPGERKWLRMSGLVLLLPHGYEGQGPEHSSARLERYLQLCAEDNMQVAYPTTPANYFHILRRQLNRSFRKPLVLMTPKSMLRNKLATSKLKEFAEGTYFHRLLWDGAQSGELDFELKPDDQIRRVIMCTGKVYYDLVEERERLGASDIYILRIEQLYPFPHRALAQELARFPQADMVWCQEEHRNMGAYSFVESRIEWALAQAEARIRRPRYVGRAAAAAPATGLMSKHLAQLRAFLDDAFAEGEVEFRVAAE